MAQNGTSPRDSSPSLKQLPTPNASSLSHHPNGSSTATPRKEVRQLSTTSSPSISHRSSLADNMRGVPPSPRAQRTPSFSHQALQDLINHPPVAHHDPEDQKFAGRDWRKIQVGEIITPEEVRFVQADTSVEEATKVYIFTMMTRKPV